MTLEKIRLIVNPNADLGRAGEHAAQLQPILDEFGGVEVSISQYPKHAIELARIAAEQDYDLVIAAGGDGTAHEVLNGLMQVPAERRPKMSTIPLGSGNDFSHAIGIDPEPSLALRQIFSGASKRIDVVRFWDDLDHIEFFGNTLGIGFDATVTIRSRQNKYFRGFMIYFVAVLQTILFNHDAPLMKIHTDAGEWEEALLMFVLCNGGREGGGFIVSTDAHMDDGVLQYTAVKRISRMMMMRLVPEFMKGTHGRFPQIIDGEFRFLQIESDRPMFIHADGEIFSGWGSEVHRIGAEILPSELVVIA
jgi:diacylglycerol kinase (ATP)